MARPPRWHQMVESSRDEALNAVEFYNRPGGRRSLEAYLVHMHIAWVYLLHAEFVRDRVDHYYRDKKNPRRYVKVDGEKKTWELERCVKERWPDAGDPVRNNLELTMRLRNRIEHRYAAGLTVASFGFCQSLLLNYEAELVDEFGPKFSVGALVHIPISLSTFSREGAANLIAAQQSLPKRHQDFFAKYRSGLNSAVADDPRFEFRVELVQKRAPKSQADLAVSFVREDDLTPEELKAYSVRERSGRIVLRDKMRAVTNLGKLRPKDVCEQVQERIPFKFRCSAEFPQAWKQLSLRPPTSAKGKARTLTDERYCTYDAAHDDYVYTPALVDLLVDRCSTEEGFVTLIGRKPTIRPPGATEKPRGESGRAR